MGRRLDIYVHPAPVRRAARDAMFSGIEDDQGRRRVAAALGASFKKLGKSVGDLEAAMRREGDLGAKYMESAKAGYEMDRVQANAMMNWKNKNRDARPPEVIRSDMAAVREKINKEINRGARLPANDPLNQQYSALKAELNKATNTGDAAPSFADEIAKMLDGTGALIGGEHRPEGKHAKNTPLVVVDANGVLTTKLSKLIDDYRAKRITRRQLEEEFAKGGISKSDLRYLLDEED